MSEEQNQVDAQTMDGDELQRWQQLVQLIRESEDMYILSLIPPNPYRSRIGRSEGLDLLPANDAARPPLLCERNSPCA